MRSFVVGQMRGILHEFIKKNFEKILKIAQKIKKIDIFDLYSLG